MKKLLIAAMAMAVSLSALSCRSSKKTADSSDLSLKTSKDTVIVSLKSNMTTGYSWTYTNPDSTSIKEISSEYVEYNHDQQMMGAGGVQIFKFKLLKTCDLKIVFIYSRPWESMTGANENDKKTIRIINKDGIGKAKLE